MTNTYEVLNPQACSDLILLVEHASASLPPAYNNLGLASEAFRSSLDYIMDIGVADIARNLSNSLGVTSILGVYSRLLVDLNRAEGSDELIPKAHGHLVVPANQTIGEDERAKRITLYYRPFHNEVEWQTRKRLTKGIAPVFLTLHSYPDALALTQIQCCDANLPDVDVLSITHNPLVEALHSSFRNAGVTVGDNFPYDLGKVAVGGIHSCALHKGFDAAGIEIRNSILNHRNNFEAVFKAVEYACKKVLRFGHGGKS